jgi:hypothetical protein
MLPLPGCIMILTLFTLTTGRWWPFKALLLIGTVVGSFFLPEPTIAPFWIGAIVLAIPFMLIQALLLVDFSHGFAGEPTVQLFVLALPCQILLEFIRLNNLRPFFQNT